MQQLDQAGLYLTQTRLSAVVALDRVQQLDPAGLERLTRSRLSALVALDRVQQLDPAGLEEAYSGDEA